MIRLKIFILLFICCSPLFSEAQSVKSDYDKPKEYVLSGINVESSGTTDKNTLIALSGLTIGKTISVPGPEIADAIKKLWKQGLYSNIEVEVENIVGNTVFLLIRVTERPRIEKFAFSGVNKSQADDLREKINFIRGTIFTEPKKMGASRIIKNFYQEKGFYNANVDIRSTLNNRNEVTIQLDVKKGARTKIRNIDIVGNKDFSDKQLRKKFKETKQKRFFRIFKRSKFIRGSFTEDKDKLITFYQSQGYRDARIITDSVYASGKNKLKIDLTLFEGIKYYYRNITWAGNYKYDDKYLATLLGLKKGAIYNTAELEKRITIDPNGTDISSLYMDDGYLFFNITPVEVVVIGDSIDVELRIFEGPQATNEKIIVEGNDKTSDYVILREIRTLPGNKFSRSDVIRSQREILSLGYFDQETLNPQPSPDINRGTVDIKYKVDEKPNDQFQLQGGWGGRMRDNTGRVIGGGFLGTVSVTFNNFSSRRFFQKEAWKRGFLPSGDGQKLTLAYQTQGPTFQNFSVGFVEPWFGGKKPNSLGVNTNYSIQNFPSSYKIGLFGASVDFGTRMKFPDDFFRSYISLGYKLYDVKNAINVFGINDGKINVWSLRYTLDRTSVDAPIYPRSGSIVTFSVQATPPYSLFSSKDYAQIRLDKNFSELYRYLEFHKWKFESSWFLKVVGSLVLNAKIRYGYLGFYNNNIGLSQFERFYLGGDGLQTFFLDGREIIGLRGYVNNSLGPRDAGSGQTLGGTIFNKYTLEMRQLLTPPKSQQLMVWMLAFAEAGNAWGNFKDYSPFQLKRSVGGGVRLMLPFMGLIGFDYGYGFDPVINSTDGLHKGRFHFMFGQQF